MQAQLSVKQVCPYIEKPQTHQQQRRMSRRSLLQAWLLASSSEDTIESPVTSFLSEAETPLKQNRVVKNEKSYALRARPKTRTTARLPTT